MSVSLKSLSSVLVALTFCSAAHAASFSSIDDALKCPNQSSTFLTCTQTVAIDMGPSPWTYTPTASQSPSIRFCRNAGNSSDVADLLVKATFASDGTFTRSEAPLVNDNRANHDGINYSETPIPLNVAGTYAEYQLSVSSGTGYNFQIDTIPMVNDGNGSDIGVGNLSGYICN